MPQQRTKMVRAALVVVASIITVSCSKDAAPEHGIATKPTEAPRQPVRTAEVESAKGKAELPPPSEGKIGRDCIAFIRATKVVPAQRASTDCPGCPAGGAEVFTLQQMKTDAVTCEGDRCTVLVTIRALFNPASGETIAGGLTAWIPPEQRSEYLSGRVPPGEQLYRVQITYRYRDRQWRAIEYDRAPAE